MTRTTFMLRKIFFAGLAVLVTATTSQAGVFYSWVKTATDQTTNSLVYPGHFDTWEFQLSSQNATPAQGGAAKNYDALSLNFTSSTGAFLTTGSTTFKSGSANPVVFGFNAPDCFFVLPAGATQLAATQVDTANILQSDYTTQGGLTLVPISGAPTTVAAFSVPTGTSLSAAGILFAAGGAVAQGGNADPILAAVPEPASIAMIGLAVAGCLGYGRRRS
jgi:hypothetical protein